MPCWAKGAKTKTLGVTFCSRNRALSRRLLAPFSREREFKTTEMPYHKSSGICCTACSQKRSLHPF